MRALPSAGTQVIPSDLEGKFSIFFRRSFFPFNALGMPSFNNSVLSNVYRVKESAFVIRSRFDYCIA